MNACVHFLKSMKMSAEVFSLENLSIGYGGKTLMNAVNAKVVLGNFVAVLGPNGVGKTTLLRTITGFLPPLSGNVFVWKDGEKQSMRSLSVEACASVVSVVSSRRLNLSMMSVCDYVAIGQYRFSDWMGRCDEQRKTKVKQLLSDLQIDDLTHRNVSELSDGEFQRVEIARALAQDTPAIVMDEPTSHLDYWSRREIMGLLQRTSHEKNIAIIACTHEIDLAEKYCDDFWLMKRGGTFEQTTRLGNEKIEEMFVN